MIKRDFVTTAERTAYVVTATDLGGTFRDLQDGEMYVAVKRGAAAANWRSLSDILGNEVAIAALDTRVTTAETTVAAHGTHLVSAQSVIPIPIGSWVEADGTPLVAFANDAIPTPGWELTGGEAFGIRWNNHAEPDPVATSVIMPMDLNDAAAVVLYILAAKSGATEADAVTFTCTAFFQTVGALYDADANAGGASSAMLGTATAKTVAELTLSIAHGDVPPVPCVLSLTMQPTDGKLGTDDVIVLATWLEYTPKLIT